ncbi:hypothetical protein COHA_002245 [Chlorella ohadii]|uniref:Nudix hydrolase domain-containing protein n=1 Tax=Chlorella ohadii TaxID=2649997 RepID=A0AAD5DU79_9CHLO|nr:hypothetical protein COHA_002245 [Chlorella ohadii]
MAGSGGAAIPGRLAGHEDAYEGLILDPAGLPSTVEEFTAAMDESIPAWQEHGYRGIWLKVPASRAHFVGHAVDRGFEFHHAEKDYLMLTRWLPASENKLPPNASHQVGVGAFVLNERREVLVVQERNGPLRGKGVWKMPTGLVQAGEDISEAAEREVLEETGVRARFDCVLAMRQAHGFAFGKSDMFFCVGLKLEPGPQELSMQEDELVGVRWMPLAEYLAIDFHASRPLLRQIQAACVAWADGTYRGLCGRKLEAGFSGRQDLLLFGEAADRTGADKLAERDMWIGLDTAAAGGGGATAAGAAASGAAVADGGSKTAQT